MQLVRLPTGSMSTGPATALYAPARSPTAPTIVYFHGDEEQLGWSPLHIAGHFGRKGCGFLAVEYPGYGLAQEGTPSEANCYRVACTVLDHLIAPAPYGLGIAKEDVVLVGHSLGCGVAVEMSLRGYGNRMMLLAPFTSVLDMLRLKLWPLSLVLPLARICADKFDNLRKAPYITIPTCVLHPCLDPLVPFTMAERLASAIPNARLWVMDGTNYDLFAPERLPQLVELVVSYAYGAMDDISKPSNPLLVDSFCR